MLPGFGLIEAIGTHQAVLVLVKIAPFGLYSDGVRFTAIRVFMIFERDRD